MPQPKKPGLTTGTKFKQAGKFLAEAKAARKRQNLVNYGQLFSTVAGAKAGSKTLQVSLKSSGWAQKLASGPAGKAKAVGLGGGLIKIHGVALKPGLADILRYNTKRAGKGSAYSYALEGSNVAMHALPGAGMSVGATGGAGKLLLRPATAAGKAASKKKDTVVVKTAKVSKVAVVGAKVAAKVVQKECTCVLTSAGSSRAYPNTTQDECRAAATLYGFDWKWECAT